MVFNSVLETNTHKARVKNYIGRVNRDLVIRGRNHDNSKLADPEKQGLNLFVPKIQKCKYGTEEYNKTIEEYGYINRHHYKYNDHHMEHFENGITDMNLVQIIEMVCDWLAVNDARESDVYESFNIMKEKYNIPEELAGIIKNTITYIKELER